MTVIALVVVAVIAFVAGVLVGRKNPNTVNTVVADAQVVIDKVKKSTKKS